MTRAFSALALAALLSACASGGDDAGPAPVDFKGSRPGGGAAAPRQAAAPAEAPTPNEAPAVVEVEPAPQAVQTASLEGPDARGVRYYQGYETIVAQPGDTVDAMAARVGLTGAALASYNGLSTLYEPSPGDELVLPSRPGGYAAASDPADDLVTAEASEAPAPTASESESEGESESESEEEDSGFSFAAVAAAITAAAGVDDDPAETVEATETKTKVAAIQPAAEPAPQPAEPAPAPKPEPTPVGEQASIAEPTPTPVTEPEPEPAPVEVTATADPDPAPRPVAAPTPAPVDARFLRPVDAPIARRFSRNPGPDRNDGVDFAAPAGAEVRAAGDGVVALVSQSLGGLGTIVLIRHEDQFLTVYGRIGDVSVRKGDRVSRGDVIARVADMEAPRSPALHFEVRQGAESIDPENYL